MYRADAFNAIGASNRFASFRTSLLSFAKRDHAHHNDIHEGYTHVRAIRPGETHGAISVMTAACKAALPPRNSTALVTQSAPGYQSRRVWGCAPLRRRCLPKWQ